MTTLPDRYALLDQYQDIDTARIPAVDFHLHTSWTDGQHSVSEMHEMAQQIGLEAILFSEHARHTSGEWFGRFASEIRALSPEPCRAYVGVEAKIVDFNGEIDSTPEIIACCDQVMASVHRFPGEEGIVSASGCSAEQAIDIEFRLSLAALTNPNVTILGHPFGMCYSRFKVTPPNDRIRALIAAASQSGTAFEVNAHYHPDPWLLVKWCKEMGARISLGSNAHEKNELGRIGRVLSRTERTWNRSGH